MRIDLPLIGIHAQSHDYGDGQNPYVDNALLMRQMAAGRQIAVRDMWHWAVIEAQQGRYDWSEPDLAVQTAQQYGHRLIVCLYGSPAWSNSRRSSKWPPDRAELWSEYLSQVARCYGHLPQIAAWEIWNEPDTYDFWMDADVDWQLRAAEFGRRILDPAIRVLKAESPRVPVISGGLAAEWREDEKKSYSALYWFPKALEACASRRWLDGVGYHPYTPPEQIPLAIKQLRQTMSRYGLEGRDVVVTEYGAIRNADSKLLRQASLALVTARVKCLYVHYAIAAEGVDYGLFRNRKELTANGLVMQQLIRGVGRR